MALTPSPFAPALRFALPAALLLFAGCHAPRQPIAVICPPSPVFGSAPIAAYDAYAYAIKPQVGTRRADHAILISTR